MEKIATNFTKNNITKVETKGTVIKVFVVQFPQKVTQKYLGKCNLVLLTSDPASAMGDGEDYYAFKSTLCQK